MDVLGDTPTPGPDLSVLYQYGAVGLMAMLAIIAAWVLYKRLVVAHERETAALRELLAHETDRADRLESALAELNTTTRRQVLVALTEAQRAVSDALLRGRGSG